MKEDDQTQAAPQVTVDDLLESVLARPLREHPSALDEACAAHAALADTLHRRYGALAKLGLVADGDAPPRADQAGDARDETSLPRRIGDFELIERIGDGGMGVVFRARQRPLGREVALKLVRPDMVFFEATRARFRNEAEAIARLDHPNIVPIHTVGEAEGVPFLVMPLLAGGTLIDLLLALLGRAPAKLAVDEVARVLAARHKLDAPAAPPWLRGSWTASAVRLALLVAEALAHAHGRGIVHRDVKPGNVMLTRDGRVLLLDFGLATAEARPDLTRPGTVIGSLAYSSPEQVQGEKVDARTDVFALGVMLYEMLALSAPFAGESTKATVQRVLTHDPPDVRHHNPAVGADLAAIVRKALEKDRDARYAGMAAFAADLRAWLEGGVIAVRPNTAWRRAWRWAKHRPLQAATAGLVCATVVTAAGWLGHWLTIREAVEVGRRKQLADLAETHVLAGFVELANARPARARDAFARALAVDASCQDARTGIAILDPKMAGRLGDRDKAPADALFREAAWLLVHSVRGDRAAVQTASELVARAVDRAPVARPVYHYKWLEAAGWTRDAGAVAAASQAAELLWPSSAFTHYWIGTAWLNLDPRRAAASLRRALALDGELVAAQAELGLSLLGLGDAAGAETLLSAVVARDPGNAEAWINLGVARERLDNMDGALAAQRSAITADDRLPGAHYNLGHMLELTGDATGAMAAYERALTLEPNYREAHRNLGLLLSDAEQHDAALQHLRALVTLAPADPETHRCLAFACRKANDLAGAAAAWTEVVRLLPDDPDAHAFLTAYRKTAPNAAERGRR